LLVEDDAGVEQRTARRHKHLPRCQRPLASIQHDGGKAGQRGGIGTDFLARPDAHAAQQGFGGHSLGAPDDPHGFHFG